MSFSTHELLLATTLLALATALCEDIARHRISNVVVLCAMSAGLVLNVGLSGWSGLGTSILGLLIGIGLLMPMHVLRGVAAGDVKLMGAIGSLLGPIAVAWSVAYTLIAGALFAVVYAFWRVATDAGFSSRAMVGLATTWRQNLTHIRKERFPYALAIAVGTVLAMWQSGAFELMTPGTATR